MGGRERDVGERQRDGEGGDGEMGEGDREVWGEREVGRERERETERDGGRETERDGEGRQRERKTDTAGEREMGEEDRYRGRERKTDAGREREREMGEEDRCGEREREREMGDEDRCGEGDRCVLSTVLDIPRQATTSQELALVSLIVIHQQAIHDNTLTTLSFHSRCFIGGGDRRVTADLSQEATRALQTMHLCARQTGGRTH